MVVVAVAGGTGNVGRTIVEALLAEGKHDVLILSRTVLAESRLRNHYTKLILLQTERP